MKQIDLNQFSETLTARRISKGLNKSKIAAKLGISSQLYGQYELGSKKPKADFFIKWRKIFGEDLLAQTETNVSHETKDSSSTTPDYSKEYIELLKEDRKLLSEIIQANLTELLKAQVLNRGQLTALLDVGSKTLATVQKRDLDQVREETSKAVNAVIARQ